MTAATDPEEAHDYLAQLLNGPTDLLEQAFEVSGSRVWLAKLRLLPARLSFRHLLTDLVASTLSKHPCWMPERR